MAILKLKRDEHGRAARLKATFVALGNQQCGTVILMKLYAPVIFIYLVQSLLSVAKLKCWSIKYVDLKEAFLNLQRDSKDEIGIKVPNIPGTELVEQTVKLVK